MVSLRLKGGDPLPPVGDRLVVGACDISGAGVRALLGLVPSDGAPVVEHELELHGAADLADADADADADAAPVFSPAGDPDDARRPPRILLRRLRPDTTLLAVNAPLDADREAPFAAAVHDLIVRDGCTSLVIVGALRLNVPGDDRLFHLGFGPGPGSGSAPLAPEFARLKDENFAINDGVIAALVHAARAGGHPTTCAFARGYRVPRVGAGDEAEAEASATAHALGRAVANGLGCGYAGAGLEATRTWHEDVAAPKNTGRMYT